MEKDTVLCCCDDMLASLKIEIEKIEINPGDTILVRYDAENHTIQYWRATIEKLVDFLWDVYGAHVLFVRKDIEIQNIAGEIIYAAPKV